MMERWDKSIYTGNGLNIPVMKGNIPYTGQLFRPDVETAISFENGFVNGQILYAHGREEWYQHGKFHRLDGPALSCPFMGRREWWMNGTVHRTDGPAVEQDDGVKIWIVNGQRHRIDGPSLDRTNGEKEWWIDGTKVDISLIDYDGSRPLT